MAKYLDPKADVTFKKVFGEHKNLVISLLNALLPLDDGKKVETIEYLPSELVPRTPTSKNTIVDVRCEETGGRKFIVEMQMNWTADFRERVLFNASKAYVRQLDKSEKYNLLQPVYALNFVNKVFEPGMDGYYHYYRMVHAQDSGKVLEGLHLVFVELPKFKAKNLAEKKMQVLWLRFLTEIDEKAKKAPADLLDNHETCQALEIVEESAYSEAEMLAYDRYWDQVRLDKALVDERDAARAELDETNAKLDAATAKLDAATAKLDATTAERDAAVEKLRQSARKMKDKGFAVADIADLTGLTADEIARLSLPLGSESAPRSPR